MSIILSSEKGSPLTPKEADNAFKFIRDNLATLNHIDQLSASGPIGGDRVVAVNNEFNAITGNTTDITQAGRVIGLSQAAVIDGGQIKVVTSGLHTSTTFTFLPGDVFFNNNGGC